MQILDKRIESYLNSQVEGKLFPEAIFHHLYHFHMLTFSRTQCQVTHQNLPYIASDKIVPQTICHKLVLHSLVGLVFWDIFSQLNN